MAIKTRIVLPAILFQDANQKFIGEGIREDSYYSLDCLYQRFKADKEKTSFGVLSEDEALVYISPIDLKEQVGVEKFSDHINTSKSGIFVELFGVRYQLTQITYLEPMTFDDKEYYIAIELRLRVKRDSNNNS